MKLLVVLSLLWPALMVALFARHLRRPRAAPALGAAPPKRQVQAQPALSTDTVIDALPPLDVRALLAEARPAAPPTVDVSLLGVIEDRSAADHALWRSAQRALAARHP